MSKNQKKQNKQNNKKDNKDFIIEKHPLQALILLSNVKNDIDSFYPLTNNKSKELIPLVNVPMIHFIIENLILSDVKEIIIIGNNKSTDIHEYLNDFEWDINIIYKNIDLEMSDYYNNELEILRKVEEDKLIKSDPFILISGDIITNLNIKKILDLHNSRIKEKKDCMMTLCFHKVKEYSNKKPGLEDMRICLNEEDRIVYYKNDLFQSDDLNINTNSLCLNNIIDCHIDICSLNFLLRITDEFDYQNLREEFIVSEVTNQELGRGIYAYLIDDDYAVKIHEPRIYHKVSMDIINGKIKKIDMENEIFGDENEFINYDSNIYMDKSIKIDSSSIIHSSTFIGKDTIIGKYVSITNCIIGENCVIGDNVELTNSHIFKNTKINNNVKISFSIIGENCEIEKNSNIEKGSIVEEGVKIFENSIIESFSRLIKNENKRENDIKNIEYPSIIDMSNIKDINKNKNKLINSPSIRKITSMGCFYDDKQEFKNICKQEMEKKKSYLELNTSDDMNFENQLIYFMENFEEKNINMIEIKCFILAENKTKDECLKVVLEYLWKKYKKENLTVIKIAVEFKVWIEKHMRCIQFLCEDKYLQMDLIENVLEDSNWYENNYEFFFYLIHTFYENDLIENEIIRKWIIKNQFDSIHNEQIDNKKSLILSNKKTVEFIKWFLENDESSESENNTSEYDSESESEFENQNNNYNFKNEDDEDDENNNSPGLDIFDM